MFNKKLFKKLILLTITTSMVVGCVFGTKIINSKAAYYDDPKDTAELSEDYSIELCNDGNYYLYKYGEVDRSATYDVDAYYDNVLKRYALYNGGANVRRTDITNNAIDLIGKEYDKHGDGPDEFDAIGLVKYVYKQSGLEIPTKLRKLKSYSRRIKWDEIRAGDIICFSNHVAIYIGKNQMVHVLKKTGVVWDRIAPGNYWYNRIVTIRQVP